MSWQTDISTIVRYLINDVDSDNYKYSPSRLETTILVASQLVVTDVEFNQDYKINISSATIQPDPTNSDIQDNDFIMLSSLKTALIIVGSEVKSESSNAISIKDGPSAIDLRGVSSTLLALYKDLSLKYDSAVLDYRAGNSIAGQAILGPYSPGSDFVTRNHSDYDHRGSYFNY